MSNDLISRNKLLDEVRDFFKGQSAIFQATASGFDEQIEKMIMEQPAAYDLDKVVSQINDEIMETPERRHKFCGTVTNERCVQYENCEDCMAERMIKIIECGGKWAGKKQVRL